MIASITPAYPNRFLVVCSDGTVGYTLHARPLSPSNDRVDEWLAETGGIHGQPRGIHSDWLQPPERLLPLIAARLEALN